MHAVILQSVKGIYFLSEMVKIFLLPLDCTNMPLFTRYSQPIQGGNLEHRSDALLNLRTNMT